MGVDRSTDRRILQIFLPGFRIFGSCNRSGLQIHPFFEPRFWTLRVIKIFLPGFRIQGEILTADLVNKP